MQKPKLLYFLFAALCVISFSSCSDDDDDDVSPNVSLLTEGRWTGKAVFYGSENLTQDFADEGFDLRKYTHEFSRDGSYSDSYENNVLADGNWEYENDERVIVFDKGTSKEYKVVISKLDEDEFYYIQDGLELQFVK